VSGKEHAWLTVLRFSRVALTKRFPAKNEAPGEAWHRQSSRASQMFTRATSVCKRLLASWLLFIRAKAENRESNPNLTSMSVSVVLRC
jgi:hypothetical protein